MSFSFFSSRDSVLRRGCGLTCSLTSGSALLSGFLLPAPQLGNLSASIELTSFFPLSWGSLSFIPWYTLPWKPSFVCLFLSFLFAPYFGSLEVGGYIRSLLLPCWPEADVCSLVLKALKIVSILTSGTYISWNKPSFFLNCLFNSFLQTSVLQNHPESSTERNIPWSILRILTVELWAATSAIPPWGLWVLVWGTHFWKHLRLFYIVFFLTGIAVLFLNSS